MRNLILLRGCPGVGKSTWIKENKLEQYVISPDDLRLYFQSPVIDADGKLGISQKNDGKVWGFVLQLVEERMKRGELTIIDATHSRSKLINRYRQLCKDYRYRCTVVEFKEELNEILKRNKSRENYKFVPEEVIEKIYYRLESDKIPSWCETIKPEEYNKWSNILFDFNHYKKVVIFGDIHGCVEPLQEYFKDNPFDQNIGYVFLGDYFDRGIQNAEVFLFIKDLMKYKNVLCLPGNHELHGFDYINGLEIRSKEFQNTLDQFNNAGITNKDIKEFFNRLGQLAYFKYNDKYVLVTHGGIPTVPSIYYPTIDYIKGVGKYEDSLNIANKWEEMTPCNFIQVHGHRNTFQHDIQVKDRVYNLCDKIEFGGYLRILELEGKSINQIKIKNNIYNENRVKNKRTKSCKILDKLSKNEIINQLNNNEDIIKKDLGNNIYSYNFSKKVFRKRKWNEQTIKARGLFVDVEEEKVVARSYDKFFNWGEVQETTSTFLSSELKFPVIGYIKENGFLGILSVNKGEWFIASKSTNQGDFADYFRSLVEPYLTNKLKKYIEDNNVSLVFEVIDPIADPHIIEYDEGKVVLLDIIENQFEFKKMNYFKLIGFGFDFDIPIKEQAYIFHNWQELYTFYKEYDKIDPLRKDHEGLVFEDDIGFMWKYKTPYYNFWKKMRTVKDRIVKKGGDHTEIRNNLHTKEDFQIYNEMIKIPLEEMEGISVIELRNRIKGIET